MQEAMLAPIDDLGVYLTEIKRFPLLSPDEELTLARRYRSENDLDAAQALVTANLRFVVKIAGEYRSYGARMLDLVQEGNIGLMMAVRKFDPERGVRLISYAVWWIRAYIHDFIIGTWSLIKIGTTHAQRKLFYQLKKAKRAFAGNGNDVDLDAMADALDVKVSELCEMDVRLQGEFSLDYDAAGQDSFLTALPDPKPSQEELLAEHQVEQLRSNGVAKALELLTDREKFVIEQRVTSDTPMTLQEIADNFSVSRERVRQIEENALRKMKVALEPLRNID